MLKKYLKQLLLYILIITLAIQAPLTAYATESGVGGNVGGGGQGEMKKGVDNYKRWDNPLQGYRFYIINENFERVTDVYDFLFSAPIEIGEQIYTTRFDGAASPNSKKVFTTAYLAQLTGQSESSIPKPAANGEGHGEEFKAWFLQNLPYSGSSGGNGSGAIYIGSGPTPSTGQMDSIGDQATGADPVEAELTDLSGNTITVVTTEEDRTNYDTGFDLIIKGKLNIDYAYYWYNNLYGTSKSLKTYIRTNVNVFKGLYDAYVTDAGTRYTYGTGKIFAVGRFYNKILSKARQTNFSVDESTRIALYVTACLYNRPDILTYDDTESGYSESSNNKTGSTGTVNSGDAGYTGANTNQKGNTNDGYGGKHESESGVTHGGSGGGSRQNSSSSNIINQDITDNITAKNFQTDKLLIQSIPLAGETEHETTSVDGCPAILLLENRDAIQVPDYESAMRALMDNHFLVVEPITWIYVPSNGTNYPAQGNRTYGSYWNIAKKWVAQGGVDRGGFYHTYMTKLGNNCMTLTKDVTAENGKVLKAASILNRDISVSVSEMDAGAGLSMHIYSSSDIPGSVKVIKNYLDKDDNVVKNTEAGVSGTSYNIKNETGYSVVQWQTSTVEHEAAIDDTQTWDTLTSTSTKTQSGTSTSNLTIGSEEKVIYIQLKVKGTPVEGDWELSESELSKSFTNTFNATYAWNSLDYDCDGHCGGHCTNTKTVGHDAECAECYMCGATGAWGQNHWCVDDKGNSYYGGSGNWNHDNCNDDTHGTTVDDKCSDETVKAGDCEHDKTTCKSITNDEGTVTCGTVYYCEWEIDDKILKFTRANSKRALYPNVAALNDTFKDSLTQNQSTVERTLAAGSKEETYTYDFVLYRGLDKVTLDNRTGETDTGNTDASTLFSTGNYSNVERKTDSYTESFAIALTHSGADFTSTAKTTEDCSESPRTDTASIATVENEAGEAIAQENTSIEGDVAIEVYSGEEQAEIPNQINTEKLIKLTTATNDKTAGRQLYSGGTIYFNPFIRMTIQTLEDAADNKKQNVNVLSEYVRTIVPNDYAEIAWTRKEDNLLVDSYMWALDYLLTNGDKGWNQPNQVLKGGATHTLSIPEYQEVTVKTYQTILAGDQSLASSYTEGTLTEDNAKIEHQVLVEQVKNSLDALELELWVSKETDDECAWASGMAVTYGTDISDLKNTKQNKNEASTDAKYYLQDAVNDTSNMSRADLDTQVALNTSCKYYRIWSDVEGNVYLTEGDSVSAAFTNKGTKILTKTQDISNLSNADAKRINYRTGVVEKFIAAIERNTGNDTSADWAKSDGHWYNEAYSGVIIIEQSTSIKVDLGEVKQRMSVIDPKLIPYLHSKNEQNTTAHLAQYKCKSTSSISTEEGYVGTFKGEAVYMRDMDLLYTSQPFYITNSTVQNHD